MERVWNGHGTDTQHNVNFEMLPSLVRNGEVWNGMCVSRCSGQSILSCTQYRDCHKEPLPHSPVSNIQVEVWVLNLLSERCQTCSCFWCHHESVMFRVSKAGTTSLTNPNMGYRMHVPRAEIGLP